MVCVSVGDVKKLLKVAQMESVKVLHDTLMKQVEVTKLMKNLKASKHQRLLSRTSNQDKPPAENNNSSIDDYGKGKESGGKQELKMMLEKSSVVWMVKL
ncbi:hypothetical protein RYX36_027663 [Vicia faba]